MIRKNLLIYLHLLSISLRVMVKQKWVSMTSISSVALVVIVLMGFLAMAKGFEQALKSTGSDKMAILLSSEAETESSSSISREQQDLLNNVDGVVKDEQGNALYSAELTTIVSGNLKADGKKVNINLRGLKPQGADLHQGFAVVEGRMFTKGTAEVIVGKKIADRVAGLELGNEVRLGGVDWKIVGIFQLDGSLFESEIWASILTVQSNYDRQNQFQSVRMPLLEPDAIVDLGISLASDPRFKLAVQSERDYFSKQASGMVNLITFIGWPLAVVLSFGAFVGILNSMRISVESRRRDIVILRQVGFQRRSIFMSLIFETLVFSILGAALGVIISFLMFDGFLASAFGSGFNTISYALEVDWYSALQGFGLAIAIGLFAGILPAFDSIRIPLR